MRRRLMRVLLILLLFLACSKDEIRRIYISGNGVEKCQVDLTILSDWTLKVGDVAVLRHTPGLERMALTGSHYELSDEWCNVDTSDKSIPDDLGDDIYNVGLAPQRVYYDYIIAMYHPIPKAPDHFITYNWKDGSWTHWKLGNSPTIIKQSN